MKCAVIGSGQVLADGFLKYGHEVMRASRDPSKLEAWASESGGMASTSDAACAWADLIVLAVKGTAAEASLDVCGQDNLQGKVVIDATNPIAAAPPEEGVLTFFTGPNDSLMERLQAKVPAAHFVKAFNSIGNAVMIDPQYGGEKPTMFICGNEAAAKATVTEVLEQFGWDVADMGTARSARAIEPLCMLWCARGFNDGEWTHAFRLLHQG